MRYRFYNSDKKVICVSSFCKKPVRGIAKCNSDADTFDLEYGKELAQARCDLTICEKRFVRASNRLNEAQAKLDAAMEEVERMKKYLVDSTVDLTRAKCNLDAVLAKKD